MDIPALTALVTALSVLLPAMGAFIVAMAKLWREMRRRDDVTDERVDLMWESLLRRGMVEGKRTRRIVETPGKESNMPLELDPKARAAYEPIAPVLKALRRSMPGAPDAKVGEEIEKRYGGWLSEYICPKLHVENFACIQMALILANEPDAA